MSNYKAGDVIRMTREYIGISREELSEGVCSPQTLYRIEYGKTRVKKELYARLMAKMERIPGKNYAVCVGKNMELLEERELLESAMEKNDYEEAERHLKKMKKQADDNVVTRQYVGKAEILLDYYCRRIDAETAIRRLEENIKLTVSAYVECLKKDFPFTEQEIMNLTSIANAYFHKKCYEQAIQIYERLLDTLKMDYIMGEYVEHIEILVLRNLSAAYAMCGDDAKAFALNTQCLEKAKQNNKGIKVYSILSDRACIILSQIENGERDLCDRKLAKEYLRQAYYLAVARRDGKESEIFRNAYEKRFGKSL